MQEKSVPPAPAAVEAPLNTKKGQFFGNWLLYVSVALLLVGSAFIGINIYLIDKTETNSFTIDNEFVREVARQAVGLRGEVLLANITTGTNGA